VSQSMWGHRQESLTAGCHPPHTVGQRCGISSPWLWVLALGLLWGPHILIYNMRALVEVQL
jgi:hypothetical protein